MEMLITHLHFWMTFENSTSFSPARIPLLSFHCYGLVGVASCHLFLYFFCFSLLDVSDQNKSVAVVGAGVRYYFFIFIPHLSFDIIYNKWNGRI